MSGVAGSWSRITAFNSDSRAKSEARKTVFSLTVHGIQLDVKVGIITFSYFYLGAKLSLDVSFIGAEVLIRFV